MQQQQSKNSTTMPKTQQNQNKCQSASAKSENATKQKHHNSLINGWRMCKGMSRNESMDAFFQACTYEGYLHCIILDMLSTLDDINACRRTLKICLQDTS